MADHDNGYKLLFSHAELMADLLRDFVREDWVGQLNLETLEKVSASYVSDRLRDREGDLVWRVRWGDEHWLYVYLLLEFQSTVDPFMASRVMGYVSLLWQDLVRQRQWTPSGKLPPAVPIVLYNGMTSWEAPQEVADLVEAVPGGLERYTPRLRYILLDERRLSEADFPSMRNLAAAVFRLERSRGLEDVRRLLTALAAWLEGPDQAELRRAFGVWLTQVLLPARLPGVAVPQVADILEVKTMLAEHAIDWTQEWKDLGRAEGREQGRSEGREQGRSEGREQGRSETLEALRQVARDRLESRFGTLPPEVHQKLASLNSVEELGGLIARSATAVSLAELQIP